MHYRCDVSITTFTIPTFIDSHRRSNELNYSYCGESFFPHFTNQTLVIAADAVTTEPNWMELKIKHRNQARISGLTRRDAAAISIDHYEQGKEIYLSDK